MTALEQPGVTVDADALFRLRHFAGHLPERRLAPTGRPGGFLARRRGRGLEAMDIRPFVDGDDIRHIDRNATARTGVTHVRTFHEEREKTAVLIADLRPSMAWGTRRALRSVAAAEALTLVGWRVVEAGGRVGLIALTGEAPRLVAPRARARGMIAVIGALAQAHRAMLARLAAGDDSEPPLSAALDMAVRVTPTGGGVFLATGLDHPGDDFDPAMEALRRRADITALIVADAFEERAPAGDYPLLDEAGRMLWAVIGGRRRTDGADDRRRRLTRLGARVATVDVEASPDAVAEMLEINDVARS